MPPTDGDQTVTAVFDGYLAPEDGVASAAAFRDAFANRPLAVVWNVSRMTGFHSAARAAWAEAVWPMRGQITRIRIVGAKGMVRVGATFLALLLGKPYEFVDESELAKEA